MDWAVEADAVEADAVALELVRSTTNAVVEPDAVAAVVDFDEAIVVSI